MSENHARNPQGNTSGELAADGVTAIVLASDRHTPDGVALEAGTLCKALAPVAGVPMLQRVLQALRESALVDRIVLCGPSQEELASAPQLKELLDSFRVNWIAAAATPSTSALNGFASIPPERHTLLTTADHALLSPQIIRYFLRRALTGNWDLVVGVAEHGAVLERFPGSRRTAIRLRGGPYCGCNLFAFVTPEGRRLAQLWRSVEQDRKRPWRLVVRLLGWRGILRYGLGRLTLDQALQQISERLGIRIGAVVLPFPEAALDVDTPADRHLAEEVLGGSREVSDGAQRPIA